MNNDANWYVDISNHKEMIPAFWYSGENFSGSELFSAIYPLALIIWVEFSK